MTDTRRPTAGRVWATVAALVCLGAVRLLLGTAGLALDGVLAVVTAGGAVVARRLAHSPRSRRAWLLQVVAFLTWAVAPIALLVGAPPAVALAARGGFLVLTAVGGLLMSRTGDNLSRLRLAVEASLAAASAVVVQWGVVLERVALSADGGLAGTVAVALPVGAFWVATLAAGVAVNEMQGRSRIMPGLQVAFLSVLVVSDIVWALGGTPLWAVGWALALLSVRAYRGTSPRRDLVSAGRLVVYIPYALIAPAAVTLAVQGTRGQVGHTELVAAIVIVALLLLRQHVTLVENRGLVKRLAATERLLRHQATHDPLTGLPGRVVLWERLEAAATAGGAPAAVAVAFVDLDDFKAVNDAHGHAAGDAVLVETARRLTRALSGLGDGTFASRVSGDEFALLFVGKSAATAVATAQRVLAAIREPIPFGGTLVQVGASLGVATTDGGAFNPSALLRAADVAMYDVKHHGKGGVRVAEDADDAPQGASTV